MRITHDGRFHADESVANWILEETNPGDKVIRTRDVEFIASHPEAIVFDVGGEFEGNTFDHHQPGFDTKYYPEACTKMSSAGLIFQRYGKEFLEAIGVPTEQINDETLLLVYKEVFEQIDARDNGAIMKGKGSSKNNLDLWNYVAAMNYKDHNDSKEQLERFKECSKGCGILLKPLILRVIEEHAQYDEDKRLYQIYFAERFKTHSSGKIMHIKHNALNHFECMKDLDKDMELYYIVFSNEKDGVEEWTIRTMQDVPFENRFDLIVPPKESDANKNLLWIHTNKFIAKTASYEATMKYCEYCIETIDKERKKMTLDELEEYVRSEIKDEPIDWARPMSTDQDDIDVFLWGNTMLSSRCDGNFDAIAEVLESMPEGDASIKFNHSPGMITFETNPYDTFGRAKIYTDIPNAFIIDGSEATLKKLKYACRKFSLEDDYGAHSVEVRDMKIPSKNFVLIS